IVTGVQTCALPIYRRLHPLGQVPREDRAQLPAHDQRGRHDPPEQGPGVDWAPRAVARRIEAVDPPAAARDESRASQMREELRGGDRFTREETEGTGRRVGV